MPKTYETINGDTWDMIAFKTLGDEFKMNEILNANRQYRNTVIFSAGIILEIPDNIIYSDSEVPAWKRGSINE